MKKSPLLHPEISRVIAELGHLDELVICDSGYPIPAGVKRIDLALTKGIPGFIETLQVVLDELCVQELYIAEEMIAKSSETYAQLRALTGALPIHQMSHQAFKTHVQQGARAIIRTGEFTPYANVSLVCGVVF
ncbi:ribose transport protein RbsD [Paenibacillus taihuensis]|uniref:D-ribose pyranase n=1 Tax=Paenibacillus taihuensis TaxID=1156355 RepID=A0A3D9Q9L9_9BACL|nr:D-ribose pyranase [Paenibacillus taihuensis]REE57582.1 ribose transport protein RbsD [Paenibacillus taihuensis]